LATTPQPANTANTACFPRPQLARGLRVSAATREISHYETMGLGKYTPPPEAYEGSRGEGARRRARGRGRGPLTFYEAEAQGVVSPTLERLAQQNQVCSRPDGLSAPTPVPRATRAVATQEAETRHVAAPPETLAGPMPVPLPLLPDDLMRAMLGAPRPSAPRLPRPPAANLRSARNDIWAPAEVGAHQDFIDLVRGKRPPGGGAG